MTAALTRVRTIENREDLLRHPVTAEELRDRCVVLKAAAGGNGETVSTVRQVLPWMELWRDHPSWEAGVWRCVVDGEEDTPVYTAYRPRTLDFHTDMSRYLLPPEFTIIRCLVQDSEGGDNLILHIDDMFERLRRLGRSDIIELLTAKRRLNMEARHLGPTRQLPAPDAVSAALAVLAVPGDPGVPCRIFDRHGATKGSHLELTAAEESLFDEFLDLCAKESAAVQLRLEPHDILVFSNWRLMHARLACGGSGRITEICMGNVPGAGAPRMDPAGAA
ncbi:TauD/TfdA family dioxygenase [Kitasatospora sp. NPDC048545]|uniref:TauD/TfdA family dioxygenase n=1 Tax=Kitasatospora sp. NPDC048545 TaxID=3157208 RepID=UPI0033DBFE20